MKPFVRYTALFMAIIFLIGAAFAWAELIKRENVLADPLLKTASGLSASGLMFLGIGVRGWLPRKRQNPGISRTEPSKPAR